MFHEASQPNPFGLLGAHVHHRGAGLDQGRRMGPPDLRSDWRYRPRSGALPALSRRERRRAISSEFEAMLRLVLPDEATAQRIVTLRQGDGPALRPADRGDRRRDGAANVFDRRALRSARPGPVAGALSRPEPAHRRGAKRALLLGNRSCSRRWLFPVARPFIMAFFLLVKLLRATLAALAQSATACCTS